MAALLTGQGVNEVARDQEVSAGAVSKLKQTLEQYEHKKDIQELVMEVLRENLNATKAIAREASKPDYIKEQDASEVAVLFGVISDKSFRILSALGTQS